MLIVDANVVLRYILNDHVQLSQRAAEILEQQTAFVTVEVICEVVYVLQKVYYVSSHEIYQKLSRLVTESLITIERPDIFRKALEIYSVTSFDIVDAYLSAYQTVEHQQILTFDEKLEKYLQRTSRE